MIQFTQDSFSAGPLIESWNEGRPQIQGQQYQRSILLDAHGVRPWAPADFQAITAESLAPLAVAGIELVLLGCGKRQAFLPPELLLPFIGLGLGVEVMTSAAACRTWNLLLADGRRLMAGIILGD